VVLCLLAGWHTGLWAQPIGVAGVKAAPCNVYTDPNCHPVAISEIVDPFRGLKWGLGVAYSSSLGGVGNVTVNPITKVVTVQKENAGAARGVFEAHYFWEFCNSNRGNTSPFDTSGASSSSKLFDSVGVGWMIGLNAYDPTKSTGLLDTGVRVLAPGVVEGQVTNLPDPFLTKSVTKTGFMALLTYKIFDVSVK
jgi:hypothetical protein